MIPLVKDNYFRHYGSGDTFGIEYDRLSTPFGNYFEESVLAAEEVYDLKTGNLHILYSGGADGEFALSVFRHLGMDIAPVIIKLSPNLNDHDIVHAFKYCAEHDIDPIVIDIDFKKFVSSGRHYTVSRLIKSNMYHRAATAWAMGELDGSVICGDGEPHVAYHEDTKQWMFELDEHDYGVYNYMEMFGIDGTSHFNRFRPGQLAAFLSDPYIISLAGGHELGHVNSDAGKVNVYNRYSPFKLPARKKQHGFEVISTLNSIKHDPNMIDMKQHCSQFNGLVALEYESFMKDFIVDV